MPTRAPASLDARDAHLPKTEAESTDRVRLRQTVRLSTKIGCTKNEKVGQSRQLGKFSQDRVFLTREESMCHRPIVTREMRIPVGRMHVRRATGGFRARIRRVPTKTGTTDL